MQNPSKGFKGIGSVLPDEPINPGLIFRCQKCGLWFFSLSFFVGGCKKYSAIRTNPRWFSVEACCSMKTSLVTWFNDLRLPTLLTWRWCGRQTQSSRWNVCLCCNRFFFGIFDNFLWASCEPPERFGADGELRACKTLVVVKWWEKTSITFRSDMTVWYA